MQGETTWAHSQGALWMAWVHGRPHPQRLRGEGKKQKGQKGELTKIITK